jgi:hypothetical protein
MSFKRLEESLDIIQSITGSADNNYGLTEKQMKAKFDEAVNIIKTFINNHLGDLETRTAADNIGYDGELGGESHTIGEALDKIAESGTGTIPPDNTISNEKLINNTITETKLALELINKINAVKVKIGQINTNYASGSSNVEIVVAERTGNVDFEAYETFDLGFTPQAVILFTEDNFNFGEGYNDDICYWLGFGKNVWYKDSTDSEHDTCLGGIAIGGVGASCTEFNTEVFRIVENGIRTHCYEYDNEKSSGRVRENIGQKGTKLYYIAVG